MTHRDEINIHYFTWLSEIVESNSYPTDISNSKLLKHLHKLEFIPMMDMDRNRAENGLGLRYRFAYENPVFGDAERYLEGPCSMLEMMVALAVRCEEFMDDAAIGNRTGQWFWKMVVSLGLGSMTDPNFDRRRVDKIILIFLNREYEPNGAGGLFTIRNCDRDLRDVEIWHQACWYMNTIT